MRAEGDYEEAWSPAARLCLGRPTGPKLKSERSIYISVKEALGEP